MSNSIEQLLQDMDAAAMQFRRAAANGEAAGTYAASAIDRRAADLKTKLTEGDPLAITARLLDVVPTSKDLDAIGFVLDAHPTLAALLDRIDQMAAEISFDYLDD